MKTPGEVLVSTAWLASNLEAPGLCIMDVRGRVLPPGNHPRYIAERDAYEAGHIPGAVFVDWTRDIVDETDLVPVPIARRDAICSDNGGARRRRRNARRRLRRLQAHIRGTACMGAPLLRSQRRPHTRRGLVPLDGRKGGLLRAKRVHVLGLDLRQIRGPNFAPHGGSGCWRPWDAMTFS